MNSSQNPNPENPLTLLQEQAWIGDAVLALYAREWLLKHTSAPGSARRELYTHLTCNQFLSGLGEPTRVEAEIGMIYTQQGLAAAFDHIQETLLPLFLKQLRKRGRTSWIQF